MANTGMTMDTRQHVAPLSRGEHVIDKIFVTMNTSALRHDTIAWLDLDRILEIPCGEGQGMKETVIGLRHPLP